VIYPANTGFHYNVAAIGRDVQSALHQKQSLSTNIGTNENIVAMGHGTIAASNTANTNSLTDKNFMFWGDDNASVTLSNAVSGTSYTAMSRVWRIDETGSVGSVQVRVPKTLFSNPNIAIIISGDQTFTSADAIVTRSATDATYYYFNSVNFTDGQYFTFAQAPTPGPGGLSAGLQVWMKADADAFSDAGTTPAANNGTIAQWTDQTGNANAFTNATPATRPTFIANGLNYNPIVRFTGGHFLAKAAPTIGAIGTGPKEYLSVVANGGNAANFGIVLGFSTNPHANTTNVAYGITTPEGTGVTTNTYSHYRTVPNGIATPHVYATYSASGNVSTWNYTADALAAGSIYQTGTNLAPNVSTANATIGARYDLSGLNMPLEGDLAEVIFFNATQADRDRAQSYLGLKWGITLGTTASVFSYKNAAGTVVWTGDATYQNRITGIGRDDASCLDQRQSKSVHTGALVVAGNTGIIAATNVLNTGAFANDKTALVFGDNAAAVTFTNAVTGEVGINHMARVWKTVETGTVANAKFSIPASNFTAGSTPYIYLSTDATFTNSDERIQLTLNGANYEATPTLLTRANTTFYFTFAEKNVLPVTLTLAMTASATSVPQGASAPLDYVLTVTNTSANTAFNVKVKDQLPAGVTLGTVTPPVGTTWDAAARVWTISSLAGGANSSLTIPTTVQ
jgi:uncharacterized repeat protein (TIGR01451 family)